MAVVQIPNLPPAIAISGAELIEIVQNTASSNTRQVSGYNTTDARTGIPVPGGPSRATQTNALRSTQQTGAPPHSLNQQPGTDPNAPGDTDPGLPYNNTSVPETGPIE